MNARSAIKQVIPPIVLNAITARKSHGWFGDYTSWQEAERRCDGYAAEIILEKTRKAMQLVASGQKLCERDSVVFDRVEYSWPLLSALLYGAASNEGRLSVLDFGGALGSAYYQNIKFLDRLSELRWSVVEQKHVVACGAEEFQTDRLRFYDSIDECIARERPNLLLLSGVLQYLPEPMVTLKELLSHKIPFTVLDRTGFTLNGKERLTVQVTNPRIYKASYPCWFFAKERFLSYFIGEHELLAEFSCDFDGFNREYEQCGLKHLGFFFRRKA